MANRKEFTEENIRAGLELLLEVSGGIIEENPVHAAKWCVENGLRNEIRFRGNLGTPDVHILPVGWVRKLFGTEYQFTLGPNGSVGDNVIDKIYRAWEGQGYPVIRKYS